MSQACEFDEATATLTPCLEKAKSRELQRQELLELERLLGLRVDLTWEQCYDLRKWLGPATMREWADHELEDGLRLHISKRERFYDIIGLDSEGPDRSLSFNWEEIRRWVHDMDQKERTLFWAKASALVGVLALIGVIAQFAR